MVERDQVVPSVGELAETYQLGRRDGFRECLETTSEWSGLKQDLQSLKRSIDRLLTVFELARGGSLDELRARRDSLRRLELEVEDMGGGSLTGVNGSSEPGSVSPDGAVPDLTVGPAAQLGAR